MPRPDWVPTLFVITASFSFAGCASNGAENGTTPVDSEDTVASTDDTEASNDSGAEAPDTVLAPDGDVRDSIDPLDVDDGAGPADTVDADSTGDPIDVVENGPDGEPCGSGLPLCPVARPWCESTYQVCVECEVETATTSLRGCGENAYCGADWRCHDTTSCMVDSDCVGSPYGARCNPSTYRCSSCGSDLHCDQNERCYRGDCIASEHCSDGSHCGDSAPFCDPVTKRCVGCVDSYNEVACLGLSARCIDRTCVPLRRVETTSCSASVDCLKFGVDCSAASGTCQACTSDTDCPPTRNCDLDTGECRRDVCVAQYTRCQLPCWEKPSYPADTTCYPRNISDATTPGGGAVYECTENGSGWQLKVTCGAGQECASLGIGVSSCVMWSGCEAGDVACDGYGARLVCNDDGHYSWSRCYSPKVCGATGECKVP